MTEQFLCRAATIPLQDAICEGNLNWTAVEGLQKLLWQFSFCSSIRVYSHCCAFLSSAVVFTVLVRSSEMCVPRNLKLATLSTLSPLMGRVDILLLPEVNNEFFCFYGVECEIVLCSPLCQPLYLLFVGRPLVFVSVANVSFVRTNLLSEWNHFMNWFVPFSVQLSSAAIMPAGSGTTATHSENCEDVIHIRAVIRSWFANLLHTQYVYMHSLVRLQP